MSLPTSETVTLPDEDEYPDPPLSQFETKGNPQFAGTKSLASASSHLSLEEDEN